MKAVFGLAIICLSAAVSQARVQCTIGSDLNPPVTLFSADLASPQMVVISPDKKSARAVVLSELDTVEKWNAINGWTFITMSLTQQNLAGITAGKIKFGVGEANALPISAMAIGSVAAANQLVSLTLPLQKLSATCVAY